MTLARRPRSRLLAAWVTVLAAFLPACGDAPRPDDDPLRLTVLTRNLYLGTGLTNTVGATSLEQLTAAVSQDWAHLLATDLPARAGALAEEIAAIGPDVVGLQEVTLWRDQAPGDVVTGTTAPNATHVVHDFLALLLTELDARDARYTAVSTATNADLEYPRTGGGPGEYVDVRITDRDVILVRTALAARVDDADHGRYAAVLRQTTVTGDIASTRGWASIDYRFDETTTVRILTTHLEVQRPDPAVQERQVAELLALVAASPHPVVVLGDLNTAPSDGGSRTYDALTAELQDAWATARPADAGLTCCRDELLADADHPVTRRVDLILTSGSWTVDRATVVGVEPFQDTPPRWASDHAGVAARLTLAP